MQALLSRQEIIKRLSRRDGYVCQFPECDRPLTDDGKHMVTLDHKYPQYLAKQDGWTHEEINSLDNLQLMGKDCNARKGHHLPDENGMFPVKVREKSIVVERPALCETCYSGRILNLGEVCPDCLSGPQPARWPGSLQRKPKECDHSTYHCWRCVVDDPDLRISATTRLIIGP
jgi:5-methylcytosine-specific restriction endonuclease McrA